jgi:S1-C subfamily serine protease
MSTYDPYPQHGPARTSIWPFVLLLVLAGALIWRFWPRDVDAGLNPDATPRAITPRGDLADDEKATIALYRQTAPSVVHVTRLSRRRDPYSFNILQIPSGTGSGFIWDADGHVVTNNHVVEGASAFEVVLGDHSKYKAAVVGVSPDHDIAVLKVDAPTSELHPILLGSSHDLQVGQKAFAIGNPFGLDQSLTTGVVSALDREIGTENQRSIKGVIQTNAAINPGNSGGPLLDSAGRLIGVNTAILSPSGASAGIGFAIPVDDVNQIVPQLIRHGRIVRPGLGIQAGNDQINEQLHLNGVLIIAVIPDAPAAQAGLRPTRRDEETGDLLLGDVIVAIDDKPVKSIKDLRAVMDSHKVSDTVTVTIERDGKQQKVAVTLQAIS